MVTFNTVYYFMKKCDLRKKAKKEKESKRKIFLISNELGDSTNTSNVVYYIQEEETEENAVNDNKSSGLDLKSISSYETNIIQVQSLVKSHQKNSERIKKKSLPNDFQHLSTFDQEKDNNHSIEKISPEKEADSHHENKYHQSTNDSSEKDNNHSFENISSEKEADSHLENKYLQLTNYSSEKEATSLENISLEKVEDESNSAKIDSLEKLIELENTFMNNFFLLSVLYGSAVSSLTR